MLGVYAGLAAAEQRSAALLLDAFGHSERAARGAVAAAKVAGKAARQSREESTRQTPQSCHFGGVRTRMCAWGRGAGARRHVIRGRGGKGGAHVTFFSPPA